MLLSLALLALAGLLGNYLHVPLVPGIDLLFGSIPALIAVSLFGPLWGGATAAIAASYTYALWDHPYAIIIFTAEAVFVGSLLVRGRRPLLLLDGIFWLFIGIPMVWVFYEVVLGLGASTTLLMALKQSVNGLLNALVASLALSHTPLRRWTGLRSADAPTISLYDALFPLLAGLVLLPALLITVAEGRQQLRQLEADAMQALQVTSSDAVEQLRAWMAQHEHSVELLARAAAAGQSPEHLQRKAETLTAAFPSFRAMYVADATGTTVAFEPPRNVHGEPTLGLSFSDRPYFRQVRSTLQPVFSDVFTGRGGILEPIVTISAPVIRDGAFAGLASAAVDLGRLTDALHPASYPFPSDLTVVDAQDRVIASTDPLRSPLAVYAPDSLTVRTLAQAPATERRGRPRVEQWQESTLVLESLPLSDELHWRLLTKMPLGPLQERLYGSYIQSLLLMLAFAFAALGAGAALSRWIVRPLSLLADATTDLPERLLDEAAPPPEMPKAGAREVTALARNVQSMALALRESFARLTDRSRELEQSNRDLREAMRRGRILEAQMRQSQKLEAIGTLAGGIAHDFNNILMAILGYTELAARGLPDDHPARVHLAEVCAAGRRARDLVRQILAFSRQRDQQRGPILLQPVIAEAMRLLRPSTPATVRIVESVDPNAGPVLGDPTQIHQVLLNLCTNAAHAMREAGGELEVSLAEVRLLGEEVEAQPPPAPGAYVRLRVRDTGAGMAPEVAERVFEPFYTTKSVGEGTGMGLAVVHGIVTAHAGSIALETAPGAGATFDVYLPRVDARPEPELGSESGPIRRHGPERERILLVDDEETLVHLGTELLDRYGFAVEGLSDPEAAVARLREAPDRFDAAVLDQTMPGVTGDVLAERLREVRPDLPIVICTGYSDVLTKERVHAVGIDAVLLKPYVAADLAKALRRAFDRRAEAAAASTGA